MNLHKSVKKPSRMSGLLFILLICIAVAVWATVNFRPAGSKNSFVSKDGQYGQDVIGDGAIYLYHRSARTVISDTADISLAKFDAVKPGMTSQQVHHIMGNPEAWKFGTEEFWFNSYTAWVRISFNHDKVIEKTRNFDGEHESPERWNQFWSESHRVNPDYYNELQLLPS